MLEKLYKLPDEYQVKGFRKMIKKDIPEAYQLYKTFIKKFSFSPDFSEKEFEHWVEWRDDVVYSFVVEDSQTKKITDFCCFYHLPSTIIGNETYKKLDSAYLFYYAYTTVDLTKLIYDLIIAAKKYKFDVFNCLDIHDNLNFTKKLNFGKGDGNLYYYLFNYKMPLTEPKEIALTML
jgi:glycylpeptide N-tetradecanoyltransferase